jgi:mycothiol synthase
MPPQPSRSGQAFSTVSRNYRDEADLRAMQALLMESRSTAGDWRCAHVGELNFQFLMAVWHLDPRKTIRLWFDGNRLAGYALVGEDPSFDFQAAPEYAGRGMAETMLDWAEGLIERFRKADREKWKGPIVSGSREDDKERRAFLERNGFRRGGEFSEFNLIRPLEGVLPEPEVPAGYVVRGLAESGEVPARAAAQREVWKPWPVGDVRDEDYAMLMRIPGYRRELDVVAVASDGTVAAYVNGWIDPLNRIGDFGPVGTLAAHRRKGLARAVLQESLRRMKAFGMNRVCVSTGVSNTAALRLYESVGFTAVNQYFQYIKP